MNWDYWTWLNCKVLSLAAGDIDGDGKDEILAGCADRHVYAFNEDGSLLWRSACQWGPPTCLAVARLRQGDRRQVLAGMADPSIHGCIRVFESDGVCEQTLSRPDIMSWSIPSWSKCVDVADVDGDGWEEVLSGVDTNHRQLIVYRRDGKVLWDADVGGAVVSVNASEGRVYAGASNGFAQCFAADGTRLWSRFLDEPVVGLAPRGDGGSLAALRGGTVVNGRRFWTRYGRPTAETRLRNARDGRESGRRTAGWLGIRAERHWNPPTAEAIAGPSTAACWWDGTMARWNATGRRRARSPTHVNSRSVT